MYCLFDNEFFSRPIGDFLTNKMPRKRFLSSSNLINILGLFYSKICMKTDLLRAEILKYNR